MVPLSRRTTLVLGALAAATCASAPAPADEVIRVTDRCAVYGSGFVELGDGTCGQLRMGGANQSGGWHGASSTSAGLRSDGLGMLPGAGNARHLRIQADPDFR